MNLLEFVNTTLIAGFHDALYGQPKSENSKIVSVCSGDAIIMSCFDLQVQYFQTLNGGKKKDTSWRTIRSYIVSLSLERTFCYAISAAKGYNSANTCYIYVPGQRSLSLDLC